MISYKVKGDFNNTENFFKRIKNKIYMNRLLNKYGQLGVEYLAANTPKRSGKTANSWNYEIEEKDGDYTIYWTNSNTNKNVNIALILQYGHGTGTGGYVRGIDYVNPAIRPIFENFADDIWKEVTSK